MKNIFFTLVFLVSNLLSGEMYAGTIKDKFLETNDKIDKLKQSDEEKRKILEENVNRALKMTLLQQYNLCGYDQAQIVKDGYEVSDLNPNLVYVQFQSFVGYYLFASNPTFYLQYPADSRILLEPGTKITRAYQKECDGKIGITKSETTEQKDSKK